MSLALSLTIVAPIALEVLAALVNRIPLQPLQYARTHAGNTYGLTR